ncbi:hypothetical protein M407DRAFT_174443 [Tulasnella calospora MUT 4182]|uniref:Uncharacterized protein n=1 Tax=Tulasnella calospora MUT 4182 TaxID=1051891 RepID=A0A0C3QMB6_9AGAM|nr:hypothetical protein M407DRAFT_174443 [Tulasnella calospora MUT 4182]
MNDDYLFHYYQGIAHAQPPHTYPTNICSCRRISTTAIAAAAASSPLTPAICPGIRSERLLPTSPTAATKASPPSSIPSSATTAATAATTSADASPRRGADHQSSSPN